MSSFPNNKQFAFTIFDDTDLSAVENVSPVYRLLAELGMRTTKSVWPLASVKGARLSGASLQEPDYLDFVLDLKEKGFEIGLHNVRNTDAQRGDIERGLEEFRRLIGVYPRVHANHSSNRENVYWGPARFSKITNIYKAVNSLRHNWPYEGHLSDSSYFWGDICRARIDYVRNFTFREINLRRVNPSMPYYDPERPFVNTWFSSTDGADLNAFCHHLRESCQDRLEQEGGVCIVHTHLACGFADRGRVRPVVERLLRRLALKNGWFVPVSTLLDFLREQRQSVSIPQAEIRAMEHRWLADQLLGRVGRQTHRLSNALRPQSSPWSSQVAVSPVDHPPRVVHMTSAHSAFDSRIFHKECKSLARAGYETYQLATHSEDAAVDRVYIRGMSRSSGRLHRMSIRLLRFGYEALRLKGNIYHIHEPELLAVGLALRACGKSVIYDVHEDLPRTILYKHYIAERLRRPLARLAEYLETVAARRLSGIVAATPVIAARFTEINANTIVVKNYPIADELTATRTEWSQRPLGVAYIGGISEERGIRELLKAMAELKHPNARLELAGHFVVKALHHELATTPEWQYVNWRGQLDRRELARLLGSVRAGLVVLRPTENFVHSLPIKLFEYMAAGIPVIASDFPLWRAIIEEAACGILVTPNDPASIAEAIHYLLTHDSEASAMGERGHAAVEDKFNWAREERKLLSLYGSLFQSYGAECASVNRSC